MSSHLIFVYGTLKRGGSNHGFLAGQEFLGSATTPPGYALYRLDGYPGMIPAVGAPGVVGELWRVTDACLRELDILEGVGENLYRRERIALLPPYEDREVETYFYARAVTGRDDLGSVWPI